MTGMDIVLALERSGLDRYQEVVERFLEEWPRLGEEFASLMCLAMVGRLRGGAALLVALLVFLQGPAVYGDGVTVGGREVRLWDWSGFRWSMERLRDWARMKHKRVLAEVCEALVAWAGVRWEVQDDCLLSWHARLGVLEA
ncbi:hypothetical protein [Thermogemmatispora sp.]|uniref:hypothetical protein n=1 Tax=Thermogemmatispora sp. TaxID=1968838 RepID=UPI0035E45B5C